VAFCPANVPPGIDFSNDPLLQGRLFSYLDTQLSRLGGPNFAQIPINAPKCPFHHMQRDGHMQMQVPKGRVNYEPSSLQGDTPRASVLFDAVAVLLSKTAGETLASEAAAVDWVRDAFGHLKAIAFSPGAAALLDAGGVVSDRGVLDADDVAGFIAAAKTRQWAREPTLRTLP
jgi:hypothetical protein